MNSSYNPRPRSPRPQPPRRNPYNRKRKSKYKLENRLPLIILGAVFLVLLILIISLLSRCGGSKKEPAESSVTEESLAPGDVEPIPEEEPKPEPEPDKSQEDFSAMKGLDNVNLDTAHITEYYTYGTDLRIIGYMKALPNVANVELVLRYLGHEEDACTLPLIWDAGTDKISFKTGELLCDNINLDVLPEGDFAWLLKLTATDGTLMYKAIDVEGSIDPIDYWTITDANHENRQIRMAQTTDNIHNTKYVAITVHKGQLPEDIYDIVLDAGHGGNDGGASAEGHTEAELSLKTVNLMKEELEAKGYKVFLSRDGSESPDEWMAFTMYDDPDGRVTKACRCRAKYGISIHLNSAEAQLEIGGIQIYPSVRSDYAYGKKISQGLQEETQCHVSTMSYCEVSPGVYYNIFSDYIDGDPFANHDALFMVREVGGVATDADVAGDGTYAPNIYRNSVQGVELALCELGFMTVEYDLRDIVDHIDTYAHGIAKAVIQQIEEDHTSPVIGASTAQEPAADDTSDDIQSPDEPDGYDEFDDEDADE